MEPSNSPALNHERVQDLTVVRRPELLRAASSGDLLLLEQFLNKQDGGSARLAGALARDVVDIHVEEAAAAAALSMPAAATDGASALHVVAASGDAQGYLDLARLVCCKAPELLLACDGNGDTPLHCAVRAGNAEMASLLIQEANGCVERKTMLRMTNKRGETALHEAVRFRHDTGLRMVKALMSHDKELARMVARDGTSPLYLAVSLHHSAIAFELLSQDKELSYSGPLGQNALHPAVLRSKSKVLVFASYIPTNIYAVFYCFIRKKGQFYNSDMLKNVRIDIFFIENTNSYNTKYVTLYSS
jgi:ankyrin repeat protein